MARAYDRPSPRRTSPIVAQAAIAACSNATIELSSPAPDPARGLPPGAGSPPPHEASASAAAPPSAPRRVRRRGHRRHDKEPCASGRAGRFATSLRDVRISRADWDELVAHAREEAPNECCGYLRARDGVVEEVFRAVNRRHSPYGYEFEFEALRAANELDDEGFEVGIYHSHPQERRGAVADRHQPRPLPALALPDRLAGERARRARLADLRGQGRGGAARCRMSSSARGAATCRRATRRSASAAGCRWSRPAASRWTSRSARRTRGARKIDPRYTEGDLVRVAGGRNQAEAELIQGLLLEEGVPSILRRSAGFDVPDFLAAGPRDVLVPQAGAEAARELLHSADLAPPERAAPRPEPGQAGGGDRARRGGRGADRLAAAELARATLVGACRRSAAAARASPRGRSTSSRSAPRCAAARRAAVRSRRGSSPWPTAPRTGSCAGSRRATCSAASIRSSWATTRETMLQRSARSASIGSAVSSISRATPAPQVLTSRTMPPSPWW